uniref:RNA-directed DNA polymerase n=1 Tax=Trichuris muris TaxID=70415 RepID=A0A5S6R4H4_TRIMR
MISLQMNPTDPGLMTRESKKDAVISAVVRYTKEGWPQSVESEELKHYRKLRHSLSTENGCLFLGARIVIPTRLKRQVLQLVHLGHFGMQRMKKRARSVVYWPHIDDDIEQLCRTCAACAAHQNMPEKAPNHPWMLPEKPWSRVHVDHAINFLGSNWLVVIDAHSKYPCIHPTVSTSTRTTMDLLEQDFAHFGYPHTLVTDNAPNFRSEEFQAWCRERGIVRLTGAPYHPATNGAAERLVQSFKQSLRKSSLPPKAALQEFLMQYRRTPLECGYSPGELLNGRLIRCKLDALVPSPAHIAQGRLAKETARPHLRMNRRLTAKRVHSYTLGAPCYALYYGPKRDKEPRWVPAVVTKVFGTRSVQVRVVPRGPSWKRHVEQLLPRYGQEEDAEPPPESAYSNHDTLTKAEEETTASNATKQPKGREAIRTLTTKTVPQFRQH